MPRRSRAAVIEEDAPVAGGGLLGLLMRRTVRRHPADAMGTLMVLAAIGAVLINALFLQSGPHPAQCSPWHPDP